MIPNTQIRNVVTQGGSDSVQFGISMDDQAHIMTILRDTLYSDKILAVLREYSANAWDAHREVGKDELPIKVVVPTDMDPVLRIRDFGPGLSPEAVTKVFTQYGRSTKRSTDKAVGMLGIGSKSGFAYADSFTITTWNGGTKYIYNAALDASNLGTLTLLHQEPCGDETGTEIQISIRKQDILTFHYRATDLFRYFQPRPDINIELPEPIANKEKLVNGVIRTDSTGWIAVMGCVPYRVDMRQVQDHANFDCETIDKFGGVLYFNIGEVEVNASREELKYSDRTKNAIVDKFNALVDEYVTHSIKTIESAAGNDWEKRLLAQDLNKLGLAPEGEMFAKWVVLKDDLLKKLTACTIWRGSEMARTISINPNVRIVIQDDFKRTLSGFQLGEYDYLVKPTLVVKNDLTAARADVDTLIAELRLTGVRVIDLSTVAWVPRRVNSRKSPNLKHRVKTFRLNPSGSFWKPYSNNWDAEIEREATQDDIYVVLHSFKSWGYDFYQLYQEDAQLAKAFGKTMPEVYGYKETDAKPAQPVGTEYAVWSKDFRKSLITDEMKEFIRQRAWARACDMDYYVNYAYGSIENRQLVKVVESLGIHHEITKFVIAAVQAREESQLSPLNQISNTIYRMVERAGLKITEEANKEVERALSLVKERYPMLQLRRTNLAEIWGNESKIWLDYIKLMDRI